MNPMNRTFSRNIFYSICLLVGFCLNSCFSVSDPSERIDPETLRESLIHANIAALHAEDEQIEDMIKRYGLQMQTSATGLRYAVNLIGSGEFAKEGDLVSLKYVLRSISGDVIYSSEYTGPIRFIVGKGNVVSGLEEAILLLRVGDKAKIVIPSHLGFGLAGDDNRIPPKTTLIYDLELLEIN